MVSVSDIGLEPENVEPKLGRIFNLAALWEAVLLLCVHSEKIVIFTDH